MGNRNIEMNTVVRARIDGKTRQEAVAVLDAIGLTVSGAFRWEGAVRQTP